MKALHAYISGIVQGVGFRWFVQSKAEALGLKGWVRNLSDGRVEVWAEGPEDALSQLLSALWQGPSMAVVRDVDYTYEEPTGRYKGFFIAF